VVPARNLVAIPHHVDYPEASLAANVVGTGLHALQARMQLQAGERLLISGAGGGVGLHAVQQAVRLGAAVLAVDLVPARRTVALRLGAERACHPDDIADVVAGWTGGQGVDAVLELVGPHTLGSTFPAMAKGGRLVIVGAHTGHEWTVDPHDFYRNEWEIRGSRNVSVAELAEAMALIADGAVEPLMDQHFTLDQVGTAFRRLEGGEVIGRDVLIP
jgi:NADPH:quinone reductase-like Zn-dependent oxidoreductase